MKRKRMIKLLMAQGLDRNDATWAANLCRSYLSHERCYLDVVMRLAKARLAEMQRYILYGEHPGEPAGMVGRHG